jgi:hypothetical protein
MPHHRRVMSDDVGLFGTLSDAAVFSGRCAVLVYSLLPLAGTWVFKGVKAAVWVAWSICVFAVQTVLFFPRAIRALAGAERMLRDIRDTAEVVKMTAGAVSSAADQEIELLLSHAGHNRGRRGGGTGEARVGVPTSSDVEYELYTSEGGRGPRSSPTPLPVAGGLIQHLAAQMDTGRTGSPQNT